MSAAPQKARAALASVAVSSPTYGLQVYLAQGVFLSVLPDGAVNLAALRVQQR